MENVQKGGGEERKVTEEEKVTTRLLLQKKKGEGREEGKKARESKPISFIIPSWRCCIIHFAEKSSFFLPFFSQADLSCLMLLRGERERRKTTAAQAREDGIERGRKKGGEALEYFTRKSKKKESQREREREKKKLLASENP